VSGLRWMGRALAGSGLLLVTSFAPAPPSHPAAGQGTAAPDVVGGAVEGSERRPLPAVRPVAVRVPSIGVDAAVTPLGLDAEGALEVPAVYELAGWWVGGARAGEPGPLVIVGHVDSDSGPAVFHRLRDLRTGDRVEVERADGTVAVYEITVVEQHPKDEFPTLAVYGHTPTPTVRLITCGGAFDGRARSYRDNVVAYGTLVG
jgi:sortase (surface protein transpeptidase)